ncbi:hypothetical protein LINPERPRIM_LOCUS32095 [Linum perenne]
MESCIGFWLRSIEGN